MTCPTLHTERLTLGPATMAHYEAFAEFVASDHSRFLGGSGLGPLWSLIDPANAASEAVARRLGARIEGTHSYASGKQAQVWRHPMGGAA